MRLLLTATAATALLSTAVPRSTAFVTYYTAQRCSPCSKKQRRRTDGAQSPVAAAAACGCAGKHACLHVSPKYAPPRSGTTVLSQYRDNNQPRQPYQQQPRQQQQRRRKSNLPPASRPTIEFNRRLREVASSRITPDAASRADDMLQSLLREVDADAAGMGAGMGERHDMERHDDDGNVARPNSVTFGIVMSAYSRSTKRRSGYDAAAAAADRAEHLLLQMTARYANGDLGCKPTAYAFCAAVRARCQAVPGGRRRVQQDDHDHGNDDSSCSAAAKADRLLQLLEKMRQELDDVDLTPDSVSYTKVINSYAKSRSRDAGFRAEALLRRMEDMYDRYGSEVGDYEDDDDDDAADAAVKLKPDRIIYTSVMKCWTKSGHPDGPARVEALLRTMEERYRQTGDEDVKPDAISYTSVIKAWSGAVDAGVEGGLGADEMMVIAERAESLLDSLEDRYDQTNDPDLMPDAILYGTVMNLWARGGGGRKSAERCEALLRRMVRLYESGSNVEVKPDAVAYTMVMNAWAASGEAGGAERAEAILHNMEERYATTGDVDVKPDAIAYGSVIDAWAVNGDKGSAKRAERLWETMEEKYNSGDDEMRPNIITLTAVMKAWCTCEGEDGGVVAKKAEGLLAHAVEKYEAGNRAMKPNDITFGYASKAVARGADPNNALARVEALKERLLLER